MKLSMHDYVDSSCRAVSHSHHFVSLWFRTRGNPCLKCGFNTDTCEWYQQLTRTAGRAGGASRA